MPAQLSKLHVRVMDLRIVVVSDCNEDGRVILNLSRLWLGDGQFVRVVGG
jgi:hypothetical protein